MGSFLSGVRSRIIVAIVGTAVLAVAGVAITSTSLVTKTVEADAKHQVELEASLAAKSVKLSLDSAFNVARVIATSFEGLQQGGMTDRAQYDQILKQNLAADANLLGVWSAWEPNALDGKDADFASKDAAHDATGRYVPYWYRADGVIGVEALAAYDVPGDGDYYLLSQQSGKEMILEPYVYPVGGVDMLITSLVVPIKQNGKVVGVAGVDIALSDVQANLAKESPFGDGYLSLFTDMGSFVAHNDAAFLGKNGSEAGFSDILMDAVTGGKSVIDIQDSEAGELIRATAPFNVGNAESKWALVATGKTATIFSVVDEMIMDLVIAAIVIALVAFAVAWAVGGLVSKPIIEMTGAMEKLSTGQLNIETPQQGAAGEIGDMAAALQVFKENAIERVRLEEEQVEQAARTVTERKAVLEKLANDFEASIGVVVEDVSTAARGMRSSAEAMSTTAEQANERATTVAAASEEASTNVETVAAATEELTSSITEITSQVSRSTAITSEAVTEAETTYTTIRGLVEAVEKISGVVNMITDIAEQTNLLALNATIEAARAGDAGKGFAVVASEVKNLATQTANATDQIGTQIGGLQRTTQEAAEAIENIGKTIESVNTIATSISAAVEEQHAATQEISRNVDQAASGTRDVTQNIGAVSVAASETGQAAAEIVTSSGELTEQARTLRAEVETFLTQVRSG